jgi:hypothetical protein
MLSKEAHMGKAAHEPHTNGAKPKLCDLTDKGAYDKELRRLQVELVKLQEWCGPAG